MALHQFIILVFVFGTLSPLKSKNQGLYQTSGKKLKSHFFTKLQIMNFCFLYHNSVWVEIHPLFWGTTLELSPYGN